MVSVTNLQVFLPRLRFQSSQIPQRKKDPIIFDQDEFIKPNSSLEILGKLRPAFKKEGGSVTAGNASGLNDGAVALLIASVSELCIGLSLVIRLFYFKGGLKKKYLNTMVF